MSMDFMCSRLLSDKQGMHRKTKAKISYAYAFVTFLTMPAFAGTSTGSFNVSVTITKDCTVTAPAAINFGSMGLAAFGSAVPQTQTFSVVCTSGTPYAIQFSSPNDLTTGSTTHQLKGAATGNTTTIPYSLADATSGATNTLPLGGTASVISAAGTGAAQIKTLQVTLGSPSAPLTPDTYTDTVTMSVTY